MTSWEGKQNILQGWKVKILIALLRSTGPGLSIWTHHIRGVTINSSFKPQNCSSCKGQAAVTIMAGSEMQDIYSVTDDANVAVVLGGDQNVGIGGWLTGGGHSPISAKYGLGVDNVLEMEVVTPGGDIVIANQYQHTDLFWAMRGVSPLSRSPESSTGSAVSSD